VLAVGGEEQGGAGAGGGECGFFEDLFFFGSPDPGGWVRWLVRVLTSAAWSLCGVGKMGSREVACLLARWDAVFP
jgi:hypothetical protein